MVCVPPVVVDADDAASVSWVISWVGIHQLLSLEVTKLSEVLVLLVTDGCKTVVDSIVKLVWTSVFAGTSSTEVVDGVSTGDDISDDWIGADVTISNEGEVELLLASVTDKDGNWVATVWLLYSVDVVNSIELLVSEVCWLEAELLSENDLTAEEAEKWEAVVVAGCNELEVWELDNDELVVITGISETWERISMDDDDDDVVDLGSVVELDCLVVWDRKPEDIEEDVCAKMGVVELDCFVVWDRKSEDIEEEVWVKTGVVDDVALSFIVEDNGYEILWTPVELCETVLTELSMGVDDDIEEEMIVDEVLAVMYGDDEVAVWLLGSTAVTLEIWDAEDKLEVDEDWVWELSAVEVVDMKLDSASEIEVLMDVFELPVSIEDDVADKDGTIVLELLVCSGTADEYELIVL